MSGRREQCSLPGLARRSAPLAAHKSGQAPNVTRRVPAVRHRSQPVAMVQRPAPQDVSPARLVPRHLPALPRPCHGLSVAMDCLQGVVSNPGIRQCTVEWATQPLPWLASGCGRTSMFLLHTAWAQLDAYTTFFSLLIFSFDGATCACLMWAAVGRGKQGGRQGKPGSAEGRGRMGCL